MSICEDEVQCLLVILLSCICGIFVTCLLAQLLFFRGEDQDLVERYMHQESERAKIELEMEEAKRQAEEEEERIRNLPVIDPNPPVILSITHNGMEEDWENLMMPNTPVACI
jgi:hypothetical protein